MINFDKKYYWFQMRNVNYRHLQECIQAERP